MISKKERNLKDLEKNTWICKLKRNWAKNKMLQVLNKKKELLQSIPRWKSRVTLNKTMREPKRKKMMSMLLNLLVLMNLLLKWSFLRNFLLKLILKEQQLLKVMLKLRSNLHLLLSNKLKLVKTSHYSLKTKIILNLSQSILLVNVFMYPFMLRKKNITWMY
jgi:hypothetical protein